MLGVDVLLLFDHEARFPIRSESDSRLSNSRAKYTADTPRPATITIQRSTFAGTREAIAPQAQSLTIRGDSDGKITGADIERGS